MQQDWEKAIEFVLKMEGGLTIDPNDPGGVTNFGISQKAYPSLDIKNITEQDAKDLYKRDYWIPCSCDDLPTPFAIAVFDMAVNQGVTKAKRILQMVLNVEVDGIIGPVTINEAARATPGTVKRYLAERLAEYARTMVNNPKLLVFAINWSHRVLSLYELIFYLN